MIIYYIKNLINNKYYVGQTVYSKFHKRYCGGRWWEYTSSATLKLSAKKHGKENFEVKILEENVKSIEDLNRLEKLYAEKYNAYHPNGYNMTECGENRKLLPWQIELIANKKSKTHLLRKIDTWELIEIFNLAKFCRENGFLYGSIHNMIKKRDGIVACNGYCLPETTKEQVRDKDKRKFKNKEFELTKDDEIYILKDIKEFCLKHNLEKGSLMKILNGQMLYYKGFRLSSRKSEKPTQSLYYSFISPDGTIHEGYNVSKFAKSQSLKPSAMIRLMRLQRTTHKGWRNNSDFIPPNENNMQNSAMNSLSPST